MDKQQKSVGIISFQGSVEEHITVFKRLGIPVKLVKAPEDLQNVTHLIIPGGESSVIGDHLQNSGLSQEISNKYRKNDLAIWGTCAGAILLGRSSSPYALNLIDVDLDRNAYGSQRQSFSAEIKVCPRTDLCPDRDSLKATFIRAPKIAKIGKNVRILAHHHTRSVAKCASHNDAKRHHSDPVLCQEGKILISTFHPELTRDTTIPKYFLNL